MSNGTNPPKKRGCFFYGCLAVLVMGIMLVVAGCLGIYFAKRWALRTLDAYTDTNATPFEVVKYSAAERAELQGRLDAFADAIQKKRSGHELILTANDLNVLISESPDWRGKAFVAIEEDRVKGSISVPFVDILPPDARAKIPALKGRYLNGTAVFRVALEGGALDVRLEDLQAKGKPLDKAPLVGPIFTDMKKRNLATEVRQEPQGMENLRNCESLQVKDGKIIIRSK